ncbi:MAG TPA: NAD-dependent epimerase/dehydratase family protein [Frankiaceae bacterium]|nr:NAD-dependent epimerase/dehydratase family protein [Frankiaceae bacterium]
MQPRRVLITGVSRYIGGRLATALSADPEIEAVVGVDTIAPKGDLGRTQFVRADIRNPMIAKVINTAGIDTIAHMNLIATPLGAGGRTAMKEINVIGTMQLLAACQKAPSVRKLVLKSTTAIYGSSSSDPALFTEDCEPREISRGGYAKDAVEVESYVRGFVRRRPDVALTVLRFTNFIGPQTDSPLTRYLSLPAVPTVLGHDPRIQLCHESDALEILRRATLQDHPGTFNAGGDGLLLLSQAVRRIGRPPVPVPPGAVSLVGNLFRRAGLVDFSPEQMRFLEYGRVADFHRLHEVFGYQPRYSTSAAFDEWVATAGLRKLLKPEQVQAVERGVLNLVARGQAIVGRDPRRVPYPVPVTTGRVLSA